MTVREIFRDLLRERRTFPKGTPDWNWRTRAARKYAWLIRGVPTTEWNK